MDKDRTLANELLDAFEELIIENHAYQKSLEIVEQLLSPEARQKIEQTVRQIKADPKIRETVRRRFASLHDQFQSSAGLSEVLEQLLKDLQANNDWN